MQRGDDTVWRYVRASWKRVPGGIPAKPVGVIEEVTTSQGCTLGYSLPLRWSFVRKFSFLIAPRK
jgi:hypothetical protein